MSRISVGSVLKSLLEAYKIEKYFQPLIWNKLELEMKKK